MKCRGMSVRSSTRCVVLQRKCNRTNAGSDRSFQFCAWPADAVVEGFLQVLAAAQDPKLRIPFWFRNLSFCESLSRMPAMVNATSVPLHAGRGRKHLKIPGLF